ncbi:SPOR domain-containing protein [Aliivibrio logei]|uniref:Cell division protein n=1 Tax=Aliivibrio logei 5S-186 TaxID=626086 RepID=A0ABX3B2P5_ALILO|nr:AAA family ATPase [Aliivibrio logei]OEF22790.1 cell division protein [Aliivibrio logei 5S-186]
MNIGHDSTVLELESQIDVLSRIQFVSRFGSNLVHIEGVKGSGKSWLSQRYLEKWCDDADQVLLMCHTNQSIYQQRGIILKQMVRDPLFNEHDTVVDSISRMLAGEKCNLVLVIDDAHLLSSELLSELWLLVQKAQSASNWQINVLLFADKGTLTQPLSQMSYGQDSKPIDIDIELLTQDEAATFSEMLVIRFASSKEEKARIRRLVNKNNRLPGELIILGEKKAERRVIIRSVAQSPVGVLSLAAILLLGSAGGYWWMNQSSLPSMNSMLDDSLNQSLNNDSLVFDALNKENSELNSINLPEDDSHTIPPDVIDKPIIIESSKEEGKRVVVPSEVVDALVGGSEPSDESASLTSSADDILATQETVNKENTTSVSSKKEDMTSIVDESKPLVAEKNTDVGKERITFTLANSELKAISEKRYILQLAALTNEEAVQEFLDEHQLGHSARIYQALRNGSIWYIVSYGDYVSISKARGAVKNLPNSVQTLGPWAKSLVQVHREIDSLK